MISAPDDRNGHTGIPPPDASAGLAAGGPGVPVARDRQPRTTTTRRPRVRRPTSPGSSPCRCPPGRAARTPMLMTAPSTCGSPVDHRLPSGPTTVIAANCGCSCSLNVALTALRALRPARRSRLGRSRCGPHARRRRPAPASAAAATRAATSAARQAADHVRRRVDERRDNADRGEDEGATREPAGGVVGPTTVRGSAAWRRHCRGSSFAVGAAPVKFSSGAGCSGSPPSGSGG